MGRIKQGQAVRKRILRKLANPKDGDDPRWLKHRLAYVEKRIVKKERAAQHKQQQRRVGKNRLECNKTISPVD